MFESDSNCYTQCKQSIMEHAARSTSMAADLKQEHSKQMADIAIVCTQKEYLHTLLSTSTEYNWFGEHWSRLESFKCTVHGCRYIIVKQWHKIHQRRSIDT